MIDQQFFNTDETTTSLTASFKNKRSFKPIKSPIKSYIGSHRLKVDRIMSERRREELEQKQKQNAAQNTLHKSPSSHLGTFPFSILSPLKFHSLLSYFLISIQIPLLTSI